MADNVDFQSVTPATPPAGTRVASEGVTNRNGSSIAEEQVQRVAAFLLTSDNTGFDVGAAHPLPVDDDATQAALASILAKLITSPATEATAAAILAKLIAAPSTEAKQDAAKTVLDNLLTELGQKLEPGDLSSLSTGAKQDLAKAVLDNILLSVDGLEGKDYATQTTLATLATATNQATVLTDLGTVTETAPASDVASSGLNGRLQRIAQRLTSLIALLPTSLGTKTAANSLAVTLSSDQAALPAPADPFGANADAVVAAGATGSLSAKLRRVTQGLEDLKTLIVLGAGTALIGKTASGHATDTIYNGTTALTPKFAKADIAAAQTDSQIVALVSSKKIRVLALEVMAAATATDITFQSNATAISGKFPNGANGGAVLPFNPAGWFETVAGEALKATTGAGSSTGVTLTYIEV